MDLGCSVFDLRGKVAHTRTFRPIKIPLSAKIS
jgi:hypothetical protein